MRSDCAGYLKETIQLHQTFSIIKTPCIKAIIENSLELIEGTSVKLAPLGGNHFYK